MLLYVSNDLDGSNNPIFTPGDAVNIIAPHTTKRRLAPHIDGDTARNPTPNYRRLHRYFQAYSPRIELKGRSGFLIEDFAHSPRLKLNTKNERLDSVSGLIRERIREVKNAQNQIP